MKKIAIITLLLLLFHSSSFALRCGNSLVDIGNLKNEVLLACGAPVSKEIIGYIDKEKNADRIRVMKIEEWIIVSGTFYYSLTFEGNKLVAIEQAGRTK